MAIEETTGVRALFGGAMELRDATQEGTLGVLSGFLARFNEWAEIDSAAEGHFMESIAPGAFRKTFAEGRDRIRCIFHHGNDPSVGVRVLGPVHVLEERGDEGAFAEVPLLDTSYNRDLEPGIRAGLYGMSFRFAALRQSKNRTPRKSAYNPSGLPERVLTELYVPEFGPTPFAAYAGATAGMRSITDDVLSDRIAARELEELQRSRPEIFRSDARPRIVVSIPRDLEDDRAADVELEHLIENPLERTRSRLVTDRLYERSLSVATAKPWLITEDSFNVIAAILDERANGGKPSREEVMARLGIRVAADSADGGDVGSPVAVIRMNGPIVPRGDMFSEVSGLSSVEGMQAQFRAALADPDVKAIVFDIDSPGGSSDLIPEFASEILAARGVKPIVGVANTLCASAAYWLAAQMDELVASPSADVGSIGVYTAHTDVTAANRQAGRRVTVVSSAGSPHKTEFSPHAKLSVDAEAEMQRRVDNLYDDFVGAVADGRATSTDDVQDNYGQGRVLSARVALGVGMVDRIATFDAVLSELQDGATAPDTDAGTDSAAVAAVASHLRSPRRGVLDPATLRPKEERWVS